MYDQNTGFFIWKVNASTRRPAGSIAGRKNNQGYVQIQIDGVAYQAHRLAWLYIFGEWPSGQIDHIDGERSNNRFANLREATATINSQNKRRPHRNNREQLLGVRRIGDRTFQARIGVAGSLINLGYYPTAEAAHEAYVAAKRLHHKGCTL